MKNLIKIAAVTFGVGITSIANAQSFSEVPLSIETPTFMAKFNVSPEIYRLRVQVARKEVHDGTIFMYLKDNKGHEVYSRKFGKNEKQAIVLLNMSKLEEGLYTLEMSDNKGTTTKVFSKGQDIISVKNTHSLMAIQ